VGVQKNFGDDIVHDEISIRNNGGFIGHKLLTISDSMAALIS
jgi:hypothetical protein